MRHKLILSILSILYVGLLLLFLNYNSTNLFQSRFYPIQEYNSQMKEFKTLHEVGIEKYAIISVVDEIRPDSYKLATDTVHCYAHAYNYSYIMVSMKNEKEIAKKCTQQDIMFVRHCFLAEYLELHKEIDYVLFIDADTVVMNPYHTLVEYAPKGNEEFLMYSRIFNYEIACGSFFFKNSVYSRNFLRDFANFYYQVPKSMHGSDNAAIQSLILEKYGEGKFVEERKVCYAVWNRSKNWDDIWDFEACMINLLEKISETEPLSTKLMTFDHGKVVVVGKESKRRWIRDGALTNSLFCKNDFLFHGYKGVQSAMPFLGINDFVFTPELCINRPLPYLWNFKKDSMIECSYRNEMIGNTVNRTRGEFYRDLKDSGYLEKYKN
uniref:Hexosyltransferase n=1 Tax=Parastrongyloides trichosuri TaxID=131310 RepID=A0A0N4ZM62_PARTI